jgi:hypothetical protein
VSCLRARQVTLHVVRGYDTDQYPVLVVPVGWSREQVLAGSRPEHARHGHTVHIHEWGDTADTPGLWLPNPDEYSDYAAAVLA